MRLTAIALPFFLLCAAGAQAGTTLPSLFQVVNVASYDALNVRPTAGTTGKPIGTLPPGRRDIEVVAMSGDGNWGRINFGEGSGWVRMRYMAEQPGVWAPGALPDGMRCFGTEPFWSITHGGGQLTQSPMDGANVTRPITAIHDTGIPIRPGRTVIAQDAAGRITLTVSNATCSDGMSDRVFGLSATAVSEQGGISSSATGCCQLQR